MISIILLWRLE